MEKKKRDTAEKKTVGLDTPSVSSERPLKDF